MQDIGKQIASVKEELNAETKRLIKLEEERLQALHREETNSGKSSASAKNQSEDFSRKATRSQRFGTGDREYATNLLSPGNSPGRTQGRQSNRHTYFTRFDHQARQARRSYLSVQELNGI